MRLKAGSRIRVVAPSGVVEPTRIEAGAEVLRSWGYDVEIDPQAFERFRYVAGSDGARLDALRRAAHEADAVWMARGGYGLARLIPELLANPLPPVPFIGFSDGTVLLNHHVGPALHAPVINGLSGHTDPESMAHLRAVLEGETPDLVGESVIAGSARGPIVGGNLCVLASMVGTAAQVRTAGCIVALEEVGEPPYKVDRLLTQLIQSGGFEGAVGFALGSFTGADAPAGADWRALDVLIDQLAPFGVPIVAGLPFGHGACNRAFELGPGALKGATLRWGAV
jgi:muramoyltetrapeptide carboxypeptidase